MEVLRYPLIDSRNENKKPENIRSNYSTKMNTENVHLTNS